MVSVWKEELFPALSTLLSGFSFPFTLLRYSKGALVQCNYDATFVRSQQGKGSDINKTQALVNSVRLLPVYTSALPIPIN